MSVLPVRTYPPLATKPGPGVSAAPPESIPGGTTENDGPDTTLTKSVAGWTRSTVRVPLASSAWSPTEAGSVDPPWRYASAPLTSRISDANGDGCVGSIRRSQLRTTSEARSGLPSEKVRFGRIWNVTCCPPSSNCHDSASAGRTCRSASKLVNDSNSWAVIAALPESPWSAGSSVVGDPVRIRTGLSEPAPVVPAQETSSVASARRTRSRRIGRSIGPVGGGAVRRPRRRPRARSGLSRA